MNIYIMISHLITTRHIICMLWISRFSCCVVFSLHWTSDLSVFPYLRSTLCVLCDLTLLPQLLPIVGIRHMTLYDAI